MKSRPGYTLLIAVTLIAALTVLCLSGPFNAKAGVADVQNPGPVPEHVTTAVLAGGQFDGLTVEIGENRDEITVGGSVLLFGAAQGSAKNDQRVYRFTGTITADGLAVFARHTAE